MLKELMIATGIDPRSIGVINAIDEKERTIIAACMQRRGFNELQPHVYGKKSMIIVCELVDPEPTPHMLNVNTSGNAKYKNTKDVRFIIWNLPGWTTCPFSTCLCRTLCYATRAERFPAVVASRYNNFLESMRPGFTENMIYTIEKIMNRPAMKKADHVFFRVHESGDFYNPVYAAAWLEIIETTGGGKLQFNAYTKSVSYFDGNVYDNFNLIASLWADTKPSQVKIITEKGYPVYTAVKSFDGFTGEKCECDGCGHTCMICLEKGHDITAVIEH